MAIEIVDLPMKLPEGISPNKKTHWIPRKPPLNTWSYHPLRMLCSTAAAQVLSETTSQGHPAAAATQEVMFSWLDPGISWASLSYDS